MPDLATIKAIFMATIKRYQLDTSWLNGKYIIDNQSVEINILLPYISIDGSRINFFSQGDDAEAIINEIHSIWLNGNLTQVDAIQRWISSYL